MGPTIKIQKLFQCHLKVLQTADDTGKKTGQVKIDKKRHLVIVMPLRGNKITV